jgi:hypothetical protein
MDDASEPAVAIHGAMNDRGWPVAVEVAGRLIAVDGVHSRMDLQIAAAWRKHYRSYWDLELGNGQRLTVYRDLVRGGWYRLTAPEP